MVSKSPKWGYRPKWLINGAYQLLTNWDDPPSPAEPMRLGTFEAAESMEVSALGNPCETAEPQQDSGPMGGRLVCRADVVWAPLNPLKTWRVEDWRWATHAKQQAPVEPIAFRHLRSRRKQGGMRRAAKQQSPAEFGPDGWPFGLQSRCRLHTFQEPAKTWRVERYWCWATFMRNSRAPAGRSV